MAEKTFLFYDIETTGLNKAFDQVLQFAAIRTDMALNKLDEYQIMVRPTPGVVPSPGAMITHRISLERLFSEGISELDAIVAIHELLNEPGTISCGYNTLRFDDEFLRFSFYRHLLPAYTHQFANNCGRIDIYPMAVMYRLYKPDVIQWPKNSLKLESINFANQLAEGQAHDAMVDVKATLALARYLKREEKMWDYLCGYFDKQTDQARAAALPLAQDGILGEGYREGLMVSSKAGIKACYQYPVLSLGTSTAYKNQLLWLRLDQPELCQTTPEAIEKTTWVSRKKLGEPGFLLPMTDRYTQHFDAQRWETLQQNRQWLTKNPGLLADIAAYHRAYTYPEVSGVDVDAALYLRRFLSDSEMQSCREWHAAAPEDKPHVMRAMQDTQLREQALRLLQRHYPEVLTSQQRAVAEAALHPDKLRTDYRGETTLTISAALKEIATLRQDANLDGEQKTLLAELESYLGG